MSKVRTLVFGGLIAAIHISILLIAIYAPSIFIDYVLMFVMPFFMAMYVIKCGVKPGLIVGLSTVLLGLIFDFTQFRSLLLLLPTVTIGILYGGLVKYRASNYTMIYVLTLANIGLFFLSAGLISLFTQIDFIMNLKEIFKLHETIHSTYYTILLLVGYCFLQTFLLHFIMKYQLKSMKVKFNIAKYPPFWIFILSLPLLVAAFFTYKDGDVYLLINLGAIIFAAPIALYGYQKVSKKITTMFIVQGIVFLAVSVPLLATKATENCQLVPYLALFVPPYLYGAYDLFIYSYSGNKKLEA